MIEDTFHLGIKAVVRNQDSKLLLLQINPDALHNYSGPAYWDLPGGRMYCGETVEDTIKREVAEETGITSVRVVRPLVMVLSRIRISESVGLILWLHLCEVLGNPNLRLSEEHLKGTWFRPEDAVELLETKYPSDAINSVKHGVRQ